MIQIFGNPLKPIINFLYSKSIMNEHNYKERFFAGNDDLKIEIKKTGVKGIVTFIDENNNGRIDGYINFDHGTRINYKCVERKLKIGSEVIVAISRNSKVSPWFAIEIEVLSCPTETVTDDWDDDGCRGSNNYVRLENLPKKQIGMITNSQNNEFVLNNEVRFKQKDCGPNSFCPTRGDWVVVTYDHSIYEYKVVSLAPLRYLDYEGSISSFNGNIGYIDKTIFFRKSISKTETLYRGMEVYGTALESVQNKRCNFRALTLFSKTKNTTRQGFKMRLKVTNSVENGIENPHSLGLNLNTTLLEFGELIFNESICKEIIITNTNDFPVTFIRVKLSSETNTQFIIEEEIVNYQLESKKSKKIVVKCLPKFLGLDTQKLLIDGMSHTDTNENWRIRIDIKVYVIDPVMNYHLSIDNNIDLSHKPSLDLPADIVSGIHLTAATPVKLRSISTRNYPHKLKQYPIPVELEKRVENNENLIDFYPVLKQPLNPGNYSHKMSSFVHLEEINSKQEMKQFVLENVRLMRRRDTFGIEVPGLSEGRPSVMVGDRVNITINRSGSGEYSGTIDDIIRDCIFVRCHSSLHSEYSNEECTVTFTHSRLPFRRMQLGIEVACGLLGDDLIFPPDKIEFHKPSQCLRLSRCGRNELSAVNFRREESSNRLKLEFYNKSLNELQRVAVVRIVHGYARPLPYVLFGPPGTGKTVTLVEAILQIYKNVPSCRLLVCAPSNSAADLICLRLIESEVVETGELVRMNAYRRSILSELSDKEPIPVGVLPFCKSVDELSEVAMHRIIVCTCISSGALYRLGLKSGHITHVFVDEAGQASEPEIMVSLGLICPSSGQIILAGDPMQLGPVIRSPHAKPLQESYLHRLLLSCELYQKQKEIFPGSSTRYNPLVITQLLNNYRAHPSLLTLPSDMFYEGSLISCVDRIKFINWKWLPNPEVPLIFHGVRGKELRNPRSPSTYNPSEAMMVVRWIGRVLQDFNKVDKLEDSNISVITPYRAQVDCIRKLIKSCLEDVDLSKLKVASVEEFQGQENEVVIISTVRSSLDENLNGGVQESFSIVNTISSRLGFLSNKRRFNVSITRACSLLIVIGDPGLLQYDECWSKLISYCKSNGAYIGSEVSSL